MYPLIYTLLCLGVVALCIKPLGTYMARVYMGEPVWLHRPLGGVETLIYRVCGIDPRQEMGWKSYMLSIVVFALAGFLLAFGIFLLQGMLPLNPQNQPGLSAHLAFNAAVAFITNTNWQSYSGEATLSYFSQMVAVTVQQFLSAATGMAVGAALFRALSRKESATIGNYWVDMTRSVLYILLPACLLLSVFLASQGVIQNFSGYTEYKTMESGATSLIAQGPAASQESIKLLGSNGGGFFNTNSAHPFGNPTSLTNLISLIAMLLIPVSMVYTFGVMVADRRQSWMLLAAMMIIFIPLLTYGIAMEQEPNPRLDDAMIEQSAGNMEGKEVRIGVVPSAVWAAVATATSDGSVNSMHDSYTPLGGLVPLMLIQFEVIFGGVGSGVYGILMFVLLTVFVGGLMVGRTPEYLGKKLGTFEIKMASVVMVLPGALMLAGAALAAATEAGRAGVLNPGAQGFSEILYAYASASNNNGSAFAGLSTNTPFYNITLAICMLLGRYLLILPVLALAGSLAAKKTVAASAGTLPTHTPLFMFMLCFVILLNLLTYLPSLALGPVAEYLHNTPVSGQVNP